MNRFLQLVSVFILFHSHLFCQSSHLAEQLDSFIAKTMKDWHVMGLAISIVKKDSLILAKGYGYRDYMNKLPIDENTIFPIASCSKAFTTALLGIAEHEGKIQLNKPVHPYFPEFQLYNNQLTRQVTVEDMLSHRTGSAGHDWAWSFNTNFPASVYLRRIKYHEPFAPPGTRFQYSNFMFFALSVLSGKLYHTTWNELVSKRLFQPLEMNNTYSNYTSRKIHYANAALKYEFKDSFQLKPNNQMDDLLGAGSINSTAMDMAHWLQMWINGGNYKGNKILDPRFVKRSVESHFVVDDGISVRYPDEHFSNIGYCWFLSSYRGHYKAHHTGNIDGFSSSVTFFPYDSLGIVVLTNQNGSPLIRLVPDFVADVVFNLVVRDRNSAMLDAKKKFDSTSGKPIFINVDTITTRAVFSLKKYVGHFVNAGYGEIEIADYKKALLLKYYDLKLVLIPKGKHVFSSHYLWEDEGGVSTDGVGDVKFKFDKEGILQSFQIPFEPTVRDIVFKKISTSK